MAANKEQFVNK